MKLKEIINLTKNIDKEILHIMSVGIKFSIIFCLYSILILSIYCSNLNPNIFYIGVSLFRSGLFFIAFFIMGGFAFSKILKDIY